MTPPAAPSESRLDRLTGRAAATVALAGGVALLAAMVTTLVSVAGRALLDRPLLGDYELVERLVGVGIFLVLPYGHWAGGHVTVDLVTRRLSPRLRRPLAALVEGTFAAVAALLAWRMATGGLTLARYGETSMMLGIPTWWAFALIVPALVLLSWVCLMRMVQALRLPG